MLFRSGLRCAGYEARMEEGVSTFKILIGAPAGKRPLGMPRRRWEDNIGIDLYEVRINTRNWVDLTQYLWRALVNVTLYFRVP